MLARAFVPVRLDVRDGGEVEQDPREILDALVDAARRAVSEAGAPPLDGVALTNQRESVVAWDRVSGEPVAPMLSWQDSRTASEMARWDDVSRAQVKAVTGLTLDAMYSAPKMRWLLDRHPESSTMVGTLDAWLVARLTGELACEAGNASRTMLLSLQTGDWDGGLLAAFGVDRDRLPQVRRSDAGFGVVAEEFGEPLAGLPLVAVLADSHASLFAHSHGDVGVAKATLGTGTSVMTALPGLTTPRAGIDTTVAWWLDGPTYALEGNILSTGQAIDWVARLVEPGADEPGGAVIDALASECDDTHGVTLVPAFTGLGAPHWDRDAVAILSGMTAGTSRSQVARAAVESVAHQIADVVAAMADAGCADVSELRVDGGASSSTVLLQTQSDLLGIPVVRVGEPELSAIGVARLAATRLGYSPEPVNGDAVVEPQWSQERRSQSRQHWQREVDRARMGIEER